MCRTRIVEAPQKKDGARSSTKCQPTAQSLPIRLDGNSAQSIWTWIAIAALVLGGYTYFVLNF